MPHPCEISPKIPECVELAKKLGSDASTTLDALQAHAPMVVERMDAAIAHIGTWVESGEAFAADRALLSEKP